MSLTWILKKFTDLTAAELYAIMQLRNTVFVVEQNCVYQDADGKDPASLHLCGWDGSKLVAYTRLLPPGIAYAEASIGRVVTAPASRNTGTGRALMEKSIELAFSSFKVSNIKIGAQVYLIKFYSSLGFVQSSEEYTEDGIPHIEMILNK